MDLIKIQQIKEQLRQKMSVLIKMDMPENCGCCDLTIWDSNNGDYRCFFTGKYTSASASDGKRNTDCPLVEVPPHGDLIDRDKLRTNEFVHDGDAYAVVMSRDIRNAPTIIPAEESE